MNTTEPACYCVQTDRGEDRSACDRHSIDEPLILSLATFWDGGDE